MAGLAPLDPPVCVCVCVCVIQQLNQTLFSNILNRTSMLRRLIRCPWEWPHLADHIQRRNLTQSLRWAHHCGLWDVISCNVNRPLQNSETSWELATHKLCCKFETTFWNLVLINHPGPTKPSPLLLLYCQTVSARPLLSCPLYVLMNFSIVLAPRLVSPRPIHSDTTPCGQ